MKYEKPQLNFVATRSTDSVADICWAFATGHFGQPFYYDIPGTGYAELAIFETTNGCTGAVVSIVAYHNGATIADEAVVREAIAMGGGSKAQPFKGSPFETSVDPSWS
ncbi:MAG: hypothetical protein IJE19_10180 [Clostridia bacterium]|nr:hypothetical protein [Clostridia bacterium]